MWRRKMSQSLDKALLSRRGFLGVCAGLAVGAILTLCPVSRRLIDRLRRMEGKKHPRRVDGLAGLSESGGTLLVTEGGQGVSAEYGFRLNPVAAEIWHLADGHHTVEGIARAVAERFRVPFDVALEDTRKFVDLLATRNLVSV